MRGSSGLYLVLGLEAGATEREAVRAYRSLLRRYHPDTRSASVSPGSEALERETLAKIMEAYKVLSDLPGKAHYDRDRQPKTVPPNHVPVHYHPHARSTWAANPLTISPLQWEPPK